MESAVTTRMRRWTITLCLLSTAVYSLILPLFVMLSGFLLTEGSPAGAALLLYATPCAIPLFLSGAWYAYATGHLRRARLLCYGPALLITVATYLVTG